MQAAIMVPGPEGGRWDIREVQRPTVPPGHVLLRVGASSINPPEFRRLHNLRPQPGQPAPEEPVSRGGRAGENGVDMIVDNIGGDVLAPCLEAMAVGGRYVTIGRMSGVLKGELNVDRLAEYRLHLYGVSNRLRSPAQRAESMRRFIADLMPALSDGKIRPIIDRTFALADLAAAQAHVEADRHVGKVVIKI